MTRIDLWLAVLAGVLLLGGPAAVAQDPPSTDIFLVALKLGDGGVELGEPVNVTKRAGYDNQPTFLSDGQRFVYTAIGDDGQADIWAYDLETKARSRVTETAESEYSPTPIPGENAISVVRVEADETQRLWRFPLAGGEPDLLLPNVKPVGYHAWTDGESLALFVLGEPDTLQAARRGDGPGKVLADDVGRALHRVPGSSAASFVHKEGEGSWSIKKIDLASGEMETLAKTRPGREDFTWLPSGELLMGDGSVLYVARPGGGWRVVADFESAGLSDITRLAVHPEGTWVAFVALPGD